MNIFASISRLLIAIFFVINIWPRSTRSQQLADEKADLGSLRFVHVVWRHGDRSPSRLMPTDMQRNPERKWKLKFGGLSQLTERGALQHFRLGQMLRRRYAGFLAETYAPEEFAYRSSAYNRTQMSALANQQGMFAMSGQQLRPKLPLEENAPAHWHIRFLGQGHDPVVFDDVHCSVASAAEDRLFNGSSQFREAEKENADFLQFLAQKSGFLGFSLRRIYWLHDYLNAIFAHLDDGFSPPEWANDSVRAEVFRLYNLKNSFDFKSHLLKRLWAGPLFTEMLERMANVSMANVSTGSRREGQRRRKQQKFHAYSGHDLTVAGTLAIFGIYPEVFPKFATAILVELHQQKNIGTGNESIEEDAGVPFVRLFHKNETEDSHLWELEIPDCGGDQQQSDQQSDQPGDQQGDQQGDPQAADLSAGKCTLEKLAQSRRPFLLELAQWARECLAVEDEME